MAKVRAHSRPDCRHNRLDSDDIQYTTCNAISVATLGQRLRQEVRGTHPHLHRTEGMLDRLTAGPHGLRILVEPCLHGLDNLLVLPPRDATLSSRRALSFDWAGMARIGPITVKFLAVLHGRKEILEFLTHRAAIDIFIGQIHEVLLPKAAFRLGTGGHRFG